MAIRNHMTSLCYEAGRTKSFCPLMLTVSPDSSTLFGFGAHSLLRVSGSPTTKLRGANTALVFGVGPARSFQAAAWDGGGADAITLTAGRLSTPWRV